MTEYKKYKWSQLNHLQLGKFAEYFVKMEFTMLGFDVYTTEVDDKGIDFLIRNGTNYYDIQVKSISGKNYIFFPKSKFILRPNLFAAIIIFREEIEPKIYLIPSMEWTKPNNLLVSRDYENKKSKPEWGINISERNIELLEKYKFSQTTKLLI